MKLTIGRKLLGGFLLTALLTLCLGIYAVNRMSTLNEVSTDLGSNWLEKVKNLGVARAKLNRMRTIEMRMFVQDGEAAINEAEQDFAKARADNEEALKAVEALLVTAEGKKFMADIKENGDKYNDVHGQIVAAQRQRNTQAAEALMLGQSKEIFDDYVKNIEELTKNFDTGAEAAIAASTSGYNTARALMLGTILLVLALSVGIGLWLSRNISRRVIEVAGRVEMLRQVCITGVGEGFKAMANGDLSYTVVPKTQDLEITAQDELGDLAKSVNGIITQTKATIVVYDETKATLNRLLVEDGGATLEAAARQDLTQRVSGNYGGVFGELKSNINKVLNTLDESLTQVAASAEQVSSASSQISSGAESLAQGTSEQASSIEEVSSSLQEMASMAKQNVGNAKEARSLAEGARASAERGSANMQNLSEAINKIKASADSTARIVKTIDEIAFQTNLLALNAAVEAARAGDAGKGFAVVAEEVRNLAMRSAESAKNTAELIEESVKNSDSGVTLNEGVAMNLKEINDQVRKMSEMMAEIAAASEQQNQGVDQINSAVEQMNQVTQQAAANAEESASASQELTSQAEEMMTMVNTFSLTNTAKSGRRQQPARHTKPAMSAPKPKAAPAFAGERATNGNGNGHGNGHGAGVDPKKLIPFNDFEDDGVMNEF